MKTAIVTGASGGIGGGIVERLCKDGYLVFAQYNRGIKEIENLEKSLADKGYLGNVYKIKFDLAKPNEIEVAMREICKKVSHIDLLVNCAGVGLYKLSHQTTIKEWQNVFSINVEGAHILTSLALERMIDKKRGKIINISSIWGVVGGSMEACYSASKSAMIGYTKALAKEVGYSGITVNCICPGVIDTKMNSRFNKQELGELISQTPIGRIGRAEDVANLTAFLASDEADFITGQVITVDGGFSL